MIHRKILLLVLAAVCQAAPLFAKSEAIMIDRNAEPVCAGRHLEILEDQTGELSFENVRSEAYAQRFVRSNREVPNFSFSSSAYWARFTAHFTPESVRGDQRWILKYRWPFITSITAYIQDNPGTGFRKIETGTESSVSTRDFPYRLFLFRMHPSAGSDATVYLRIRNSGISIFPVDIVPENVMAAEMERENLFTGAFLGVMAIIIFYHLLLFTAVRERDYIYFSAFIAVQVFVYALNDGILSWHLGISGGSTPQWMMASACVAGIILVSFTGYLLNLKNEMPAAGKLFLGISAAYALYGAASFIFPSFISWGKFFAVSFTANVSALAVSVILFAKRRRIAGYMTAFFIILIATGLASTLLRADILPFNGLTAHIRPAALLAQAMLLSFALTRRIRMIEHDRVSAQTEAIRSLELADRIKNDFLAATSHELRTPLHGIIWLAELTQRNSRAPLPPAAAENLKLISSNGHRLLSLINDLLDFTRMKHADIQLKREPVDVRSTVSIVFSLLSPLTAGRAVELRNSVPEDLPAAFADENRLKQIITNLAGNAIKFTEFGVIEVRAETAGGGMLLIEVNDTGVGIGYGDEQRIFEPFEQGDSTVSRAYEGTGLGLAITKKLVELLGGTISASRRTNGGSSFTFTLPSTGILLRPGEARAASEPISPRHPRSKSAGETPLILIVDDDPVSVKILAEFLDLRGYAHMEASDGKQALGLLLHNPGVKIVLLDIMMPGMSGYETLAKLRKERSSSELPVIVTTARSQLNDISDWFRAGANDYIIKPFSFDELSNRIDNLLAATAAGERTEPGIRIKGTDGEHYLNCEEIIYLSSAGKKSVIHTAEKDIESAALLKDIEARLPEDFVRIHKQHIINIAHLAKIERRESWSTEVILRDADDTRLAVGRTFIAELKRRTAFDS